jgi:hypothetical protein
MQLIHLHVQKPKHYGISIVYVIIWKAVKVSGGGIHAVFAVCNSIDIKFSDIFVVDSYDRHRLDFSLTLCNCAVRQPTQFILPGAQSADLLVQKLLAQLSKSIISYGRVHFDAFRRSVLLVDFYWLHVHSNDVHVCVYFFIDRCVCGGVI